MQYAIIAAGEGSRLAQEGISVQKPFVRLHGETLLERLVRIFCDNGAEDIVVAMRPPHAASDAVATAPLSTLVPSSADRRGTIVYCSTPSSMHTFHAMQPYIGHSGPFILTTVDTVFREDDFSEYVRAFVEAVAEGYDGLMGVTDYVDDEKPLYVMVDGDEIEGFHDEPCSRFVSAGVYGLTPAALATLERCVARGESRMRNFQRALIAEGMRLKAWRFAKVIDVDHASDIGKAETLLRNAAETHDSALTTDESPNVVYVLRAPEHSPGREADDTAIMMAIRQRVGEGLVINESELSKLSLHTPPLVFSMARSHEALAMLRQWESDGAVVINTPSGVEGCRRSRWDALMRQHSMPVPPAGGNHGWWLKRGDTAATAGSIAFCRDAAELAQAKQRFARLGISDTVVQAHVEGSLLKFYGVAPRHDGEGGEAWFWWGRSQSNQNTQNNQSSQNNQSNQNNQNSLNTPIIPTHQLIGRLRVAAEMAARLVGVEVYGGDAIVTAEGDFYFIDFNDWPSFSPCREEAAEMISKLAMARKERCRDGKM